MRLRNFLFEDGRDAFVVRDEIFAESCWKPRGTRSGRLGDKSRDNPSGVNCLNLRLYTQKLPLDKAEIGTRGCFVLEKEKVVIQRNYSASG